jgi:1-acyl-sn-glycerol-3-phosphate acyltransferase
VAAVRAGECVIVYPEGSITRDPDLWPMTGKSGAARIALATGAPVIPIGQWGAQHLLPPYAKRPHPFPRKQITMKVGDRVDLSDLAATAAEGEHSAEVVRQATDRIMAALVALVEEIRGERAPVERYSPRAHGVAETGNPHPHPPHHHHTRRHGRRAG